MARRLFLHVGTIKSATTYVQAICDANADALGERGLLWLGAAANFSAVADVLDITRPDEYGPEAMTWTELVQRIDRHDGDALVSNELLSFRAPKKVDLVNRSLPKAETRVVVTARDFARVTVSQWQERARHRPTGGWDEFMAALTSPESRADPDVAWFWRRQDLPRLIGAWSEHVGLANIVVVTVPPAGSPSGLFAERFFGELGVPDASALTVPSQSQNQALGTRSVELIRRVQQRLDDDERERLHLVLKYILTRRVLAERAAAEPALTLSAEQLRWAREQAAAMADQVRATGVRVVGDLDDLIPGPDETADPPAEPTASELLDCAIDAVVGIASAADDLARAVGADRYGDTVRTIAGRGRAQP